MPRHPSDISGEGLYILCHGHKDVEAIREALRREAMAVDGIEYEETSKVVLQLNDANSDWLWLQRLPYQVSICKPPLLALAGSIAHSWRLTVTWRIRMRLYGRLGAHSRLGFAASRLS